MGARKLDVVETQARGLLLLLTLWHNAQGVGAAVAGSVVANDSWVFADEDFGQREDLFGVNSTGGARLADHAGAPARGLVAVVAGWPWPADTMLSFKSQHDVNGLISVVGSTEVIVCASLLYNTIEIFASGTNFGSDHSAARVKLVTNAARREQCSTTDFDVPVGIAARQDDGTTVKGAMGLSSQPLPLNLNGDTLSATGVNIVFMMGGLYKLCYTPDGSFGGGDQSEYKENVVNTVIKVLGVKSPCPHGLADGCMENERWDCSYGYKGESVQNCEFNVKTDGGRGGGTWSVEPGVRSRMTWSSLYGADLHANGVLQSSTPRYCTDGTAPETSILDTSVTGYFLTMDQTTSATMPLVKSDQTEAFTLAACYCPSYNAASGTYCSDGDADQCCDNQQEYIQQFGVIYFWTIWICDYANYQNCNPPHRYMRVLPQQKFTLRIDCPPGGGCVGSTANRIQYIEYSAYNDRPSWDASNGCQTVGTEAEAAVWPEDADRNAAIDGGDRIDYKVWREKQVKINLSLKKKLDVCFCNVDCSLSPKIPANWFRVGQIRTTAAFAFASKTSAASSHESIRYVGYPGDVTFYGGIAKEAADASTTVNPYESNMYSGEALVKILSYDREESFGVGTPTTMEKAGNWNRNMPLDFQAEMDRLCQTEPYSSTLVTGPSTVADAKVYVAKVGALDNEVSQYLTFSGTTQQNVGTTIIKKAGVIAICYCAMVTARFECEDRNYWLFAGRMTIQGPMGGQRWELPTHIVLKLKVYGWGLSNNDKLRIIPASSTCSSNSNNPAGDTSFKVGCPAKDGADCRTVSTTEQITVNALTASSTGIYINDIQPGLQQSTVHFTGSVQDVLKADDTITIDFNRVLVNGKDENSMGPDEEFEAYRLSGEYQFQDDYTKTYMVGHALSEVVESGSTVHTKMSIPIGWNNAPVFSFLNSQGYWMRRNEVETNEDMKATQQQTGLKVCWGVYDVVTGTRFYEQAGEVSFNDPPSMRSARVSLTTKQRGAIAPFVISFATYPQRPEYARAEGKTMLMIRFLDVSDSTNNGKLVPRFAGDSVPGGSGPDYIPTSGSNEDIPYANMQQWVCGRLFAELWSNDPEGFPLPAGCYYGKKYRDQPEGGNEPDFYREMFIVFAERNGLRQFTEYQIVMNAEVKDIAMNENIVDLYAMCAEEAGCESPYKVFEKGMAVASLTTTAEAGGADSKLTNVELQRVDPVTKVQNISDDRIIQVLISGGNDVNAIRKEQFIRLYLWPLTQWNIYSADCSAICLPYDQNNAICQGLVGCTPEMVVSEHHYNIIKLKLPSEMTPMTSTTKHTIKVMGLTPPLGGFFPTRLGVQLTGIDDDKPVYLTTDGFITKAPEAGKTNARLVMSGRTGDGPHPFMGDVDNILYVRLQFGATMWNYGAPLLTSQFEITLPEGYTCRVPGAGAPSADMPVFTADENSDGYPDNNRGVLAVDSYYGNWARSAGRRCTYELGPYTAIFADQVAYVELTVNNPTISMPKLNNKNVWRLKLSGKGMNAILTTMVDMPEVQFSVQGGGSQYWASNAAVLSQLQQEVLQPSEFTRSCCGPTFDQRKTQELLQVFFQTTQDVGQHGFVILDAPDGFDFLEACTAMDLHDDYYAFIGTEELVVNRLKNMESCIGSRYPITASTYNRAGIQVAGFIRAGLYYGFQVRVTHPSVYDTSQHTGWYLWTQDINRYPLEGSYSTIKFNKLQAASQTEFYHKSFGMYDADASAISVQIMNIRPKSITQQDAQVIFYPIEFPIDTDTSLRITSPIGFVWADPSGGGNFQRTTNGTSEEFPVPDVHIDVNNQLIWNSMTLKGATRYGFRAMVAVPNHNPVVSSNAFFIEFGFREPNIDFRYKASVVQAPLVAALINAEVAYNSNLVAYADNRLEFRVQLITPLTEGEGIVIKGDENTRGFDFTCSLTMLEGSAAFPVDLLCMRVPSNDDLPQITLKAGVTTVQPAYYKFELPVVNPATRILTPGRWTLGTFRQVSDYPSAPPIDKELVAPGFVVNEAMTSALMVDLDFETSQRIRRNDRPGKRNNLIFEFQLRSRPSVDQDMILRAPRGFHFDEDCLPWLKTASDEIFSDGQGGTLPAKYTAWPLQFAPTACLGNGRDARISIPVGLLNRNLYAFRIGVERNPLVTPVWNKWSISYNSETSEPFPGFQVWTFSGLSVTPTSTARSPNLPGGRLPLTENPVTFTFQPYNTIPAKPPYESQGGMLRIIAPTGFAFVETSRDECAVMLFETGSDSFFAQGDMLCRVQNKVTLELYLVGDKAMEGGKLYTLVARVTNPVGTSSDLTWTLDSFRDTEEEPYTELDESQLSGFPINPILVTFLVDNVNDVRNGGAALYDVELTLRFLDPLKDDDEIIIQGPTGFNLEGNADTATCNDFRYADDSNPLPRTGDPQCTCVAQVCTLKWVLNEDRDPAFQQSQDLVFKIGTANPVSTPFATSNFWSVEHRRGTVIKSSHVYESWSINPQLGDVDIKLKGSKLAAASESDISVSFVPVSNADTLKLEALLPTEFDFGRATVSVPFDIDDRTEGSTVIINRLNLIAGQSMEIRINSVMLGRAGGQTKFNLITYSDETLSEKMDERLEFTDGFRLPGRITVEGTPQLKSQYREARSMFPVKSLFQPRVLEPAKAEFRLSFSQEVTAAQKLIITCQGAGAYTLKTSPFVIIGTGQVETSVELDANGALQATLKPGRPATEVALQADTPYTVIMWVIPQPGTNNWRFDTSVGEEYPTNTNDGETSGFNPVEKMTLGVVWDRTPPRAIIEVTLNIDQGSAVVRELVVIAPPSFTFDEQGCGDNCMAGQALGSTGRRTATIASPTGMLLTKLQGIRIRVKTPEHTPDSRTWFVEGRGQGAGTTTGWGEGEGFPITQMSGTTVSYAGVANLQATQMAVTFTMDAPGGTQITVVPAPGILLTCSREGALQQISLPGGKPDCIDFPLQLTLTQTLAVGTYAFAVEADLPPQTPEENTFNVIIRDKDDNVVDAAYQIQGQPIVDIGAGSVMLAWSRAVPGQHSMITVGITFVEDTINIKAILINMPMGFFHDVQQPTDVQSLNRDFPVKRGQDWADTQSAPDAIKIFLNDDDDSTTIPAGNYKFNFPVQMPTEIPRINLWSLSLCGDTACKTPGDRGVVVSFPLDGFDLYELAPGALRVAANTAKRKSHLGMSVCMLLGAAAFLVETSL